MDIFIILAALGIVLLAAWIVKKKFSKKQDIFREGLGFQVIERNPPVETFDQIYYGNKPAKKKTPREKTMTTTKTKPAPKKKQTRKKSDK